MTRALVANAAFPKTSQPPTPAGRLLQLGRRIAVGALFGGATAAFLPIFLVRFRNPSNNRLFCQVVSPLVFKILGLRFEARGVAGLDEHRPCVFVANHQSALDPIVHGYVYPKRTVAIWKRSNFWIPFFGQLVYLAGNLAINREHRKSALGTMQVAHDAITRHDTSAWIFPEGTRRYGEPLGEFKKGAFHCAIACQSPVVPVIASTFHGVSRTDRRVAGKIIVEVLPAVPTVGLGVGDVADLRSRVHAMMAAGIERLDAELRETTLA